jgi:hypothetical protein
MSTNRLVASIVPAGHNPPVTRRALALAVVLAAGAWPWLFMLSLWPNSDDAAYWITRGNPSEHGWVRWVFASRQFNVGYRPVTALSYSANALVGGWSIEVYRATDLALHLACALLVVALYRRVASRLPVWGGVAAAAAFVLHPLGQEVVPNLARRSYSLATVIGLSALLLAARAGSRARRCGVAILLAGATLANEAALLFAAALPVMLWLADGDTEGRRARRAIRASLLPVAAVAIVLLARCVWLGGVGGYAVTPERRLHLAGPIFFATWNALTWTNPLAADARPSLIARCVALVGWAYYAWRAALEPALRRAEDRTAGAAATAILWLALGAGLFASLGVWFPRQVYILVAPFALMAGAVAASSVSRWRHRPATLLAHGLVQLVVWGWIGAHSPVFHGADAKRVAAWRAETRVMRDLHAAVVGLPGSPKVLYAIPTFARPELFAYRPWERGVELPLDAGTVQVWVSALLREKRASISPLLTFEADPAGGTTRRPSLITHDGGAVALRVPKGIAFHPRAGLEEEDSWIVPLEGGHRSARHVFLHDGLQGRLVPIAPGKRTADLPPAASAASRDPEG